MTNKFEPLPADLDTQILLYSKIKFGEIDCIFQAWVWDSVQANSLIFLAEDVKNQTDDELKDWISSQSELVQNKSSMNVSRNSHKDNFVFLIFDFKAVD